MKKWQSVNNEGLKSLNVMTDCRESVANHSIYCHSGYYGIGARELANEIDR